MKELYIKVSENGKQMREHVAIAEAALGRPLPKGSCVHHVDYDKTNNANSNLVICQSKLYHYVLHRRTDALLSCGHADWLKCWICKSYSPPQEIVKAGRNYYHRVCDRKRQKIYREDHK